MVRMLLGSIMLLLASGAVSEVDAQYCIGIQCKADNTCGSNQGSTYRNCCCQPVCGPFGCTSCLQSCWTACHISCASIVCPNCKPTGGSSAEAAGFVVSPGLIEAAWGKHLVAGIVLHGRAMTPQGEQQGSSKKVIHSDLVRGGTSLFGHQVGFDVSITSQPQYLRLDMAFDAERSNGPVPSNVRFEVDSSGKITLIDLPGDGLMAIQRQLALRELPCEQVLLFAMAMRP
jgi:hypothetical protein